MKDVSKEFRSKIFMLAEHTLALLVFIFLIWLLQIILDYVLGKDMMFFRVIPIRYITDMANLIILIRYLYTLIRAFQLEPAGDIRDAIKVTSNETDSDESANNRTKDTSRLTVAELLASHKAKRNIIASLIMALPASAYFILSRQLGIEPNIGILSIVGFLILALYVNQRALTYRIRKRIYGTNEYEAREIIKYILKNSDNVDFSDSDGLKQLLPQLERETITGISLAGELGEVEG